MSYVMVQNKGELPIWGMRLMGLSKKTAQQIGQFGTGLKESIALMARMDLYPVIYSGNLRMDFAVLDRDGQDEICFQLSQDRGSFEAFKWHGLGIHPDFGKADWNDPWMIFREVVCNALDESGTDDLYHDVVSTDPEGVAGSTRVYIPITPEILEAYSSIHRRLLPLGDYDIESNVVNFGRAIVKRDEKEMQVFHRGVWIQQSEEVSLFDYEIDTIKLNESRSADWYNVNTKVAYVLAEYSEAQAKTLLDRMLVQKDDGFYERKVLHAASYYVNVDMKNWANAWEDLFGEQAVMIDNDKFHYDRLEKKGYKPVVVEHEGLRMFLKAAGIRIPSQILTREQQDWEDVTDPSPETQQRFDLIWELFGERGLTKGVEKPPVRMFTQRPGSADMVLGAYRSGKCYINIQCVGSPHERVACIEEIAHHITKATDYSKEFQHFLVEVLEKFMFQGETV